MAAGVSGATPHGCVQTEARGGGYVAYGGWGFWGLGFLGLLHMDVFRQRLEEVGMYVCHVAASCPRNKSKSLFVEPLL